MSNYVTCNQTSEQLRKLLDERGVKYKSHYLNTSWYAGTKLYMATDDMNGTLTVDSLTPEQAIAATLGNGTLTAEQVSKAVYAHSIHADCTDADWQAIADELNARTERTCGEYGSVRVWQSCNIWSHELSCGHEIDTLEKEPPNYCPNCGAKVRNE